MSKSLILFSTNKLYYYRGGIKGIPGSGVYIGLILSKEDGYYDFFPELKEGLKCWSAGLLREITTLLDDLNATYFRELESMNLVK